MPRFLKASEAAVKVSLTYRLRKIRSKAMKNGVPGLFIFHVPEEKMSGAHVVRYRFGEDAVVVSMRTGIVMASRLAAYAMLTEDEKSRLEDELGSFQAVLNWLIAEQVLAVHVPEPMRHPAWRYRSKSARLAA